MIYKKCIIIISFIFLSNCDNGNDSLMPLEGKLKFKLYETHIQNNEMQVPKIALYLETEKQYGCYNWTVSTIVNSYESGLDITILGVSTHDICLTAFGPATKTLYPNLPKGTSKLYLNYLSQKDIYSIKITDSSIQVTQDRSNFTVPLFKSFYRYPINSFAYICGTNTTNTWIYQDFIDTITQNINLQEIYFANDWTIPYPDSSYGHYCNFPSRIFKYQDEMDYEQIGAILGTYKQNVLLGQSGASIWLTNWKNKRYNGY